MNRSPAAHAVTGLTAALLLCSAVAVPAAQGQDLLQNRPAATPPLVSGNLANAILPVEEAFALQLDSASDLSLELHWRIAPGHYLYRKSLQLSLSDGTVLDELALPAGVDIEDEYFGAVEVYYDSLELSLPPAALATAARKADAEGALSLQVQFQGCAAERYCYPPHQQSLPLPLP